MGLFSGKTTITVSSTLYNLAGPEEDRPDYLKGTLFSSVMADSPSIADDITNSYFNGPGLKQRQFFNYAVRNNLAGLPTVTATQTASVDSSVVAPFITIPSDPPDMELSIQSSLVVEGDPEPFLERWILANHPDRITEQWTGDVEGSDFSVQFPNGDFYEFTDTQYSTTGRYIIATYILTTPTDTDDLVEGTPTTVTSLPDFTGWDEDSSTGSFTPTTLQREMVETRSYSDGRPDEVDAPVDADVVENANTSVDVHSRTVIVGAVFYETESEFQQYTHTGTDTVVSGYDESVVTDVTDIGGGVTRTTTQRTTGEQLSPSWTEQYDTQAIYEGTVVGGEQKFIYTVGTGNTTLDALASSVDASDFQEFFPFLPIRLNNVSIFDAPYDSNGLYDETKSAYRRATDGRNFDDIVDDIEANDSIADIDYSYMMYGVSLNVKENACRKYAYNFFLEMRNFQATTAASLPAWQAELAAYQQGQSDLAAWQAEVNSRSDEDYSAIPERPATPGMSDPPTTSLNLRTGSSLMPSYDIRIQWVFIEETQHSGKYTVTPVIGDPRDAEKDEVEFRDGTTINWTTQEGYQTRDGEEFRTISHSLPSIEMYWQVDDDNYRKLTIYGLVHQNYIYGGKSVKITSAEALADTDISGFIVPLHMPTMKSLGIVDYTQMATANVHVIFNSYEVTKQKWYETFLFKLLLIILVIVLVVVIAPAGFAAGSGLLGGNAAIGAALGLSGTAAIVAGVVANYLASIVISQLLSVVGTALFGEKWGAVFAAIVGFALTAGLSGTSLFSAQGILGMANAVANGYAGWVQGDINEMSAEFEEEANQYEEQMEYINDLIAGLGGNDLNFNPLSLTSTSYGNGRGSGGGYLPETADEFIRRTTMTGTDVVEITQSMVYNFVDVQQTLPRN